MKTCPSCGARYGAAQKFCPADGSVLRADDPQGDLVDAVIADRYHVSRRLGEGGMGVVYEAEHLRMGRTCAIKVLSRSLTRDADAIARFNREAANASRISHPNVCLVYDFGETGDGLIYLAMEYLDGGTLTEALAGGPMSVEHALPVLEQCAAGLTAAHDLGIVHRDLKPDNIMLVGPGDRPVVKVVDFGIAKAGAEAAQQVTRTGLVVGTPEYMSPEQLAGAVVDARTDQYALGLIAFRMLTGTLPFRAESPQEVMVKRLTEAPLRLDEARPGTSFPPQVQEAIGRALARRPEDRFPTVQAFVAALGGAGSAAPGAREAPTRPLETLGSPPPTRVSRPPRRARGVAPLVLGSAIVIVALLAGRALVAPSRADPAADTTGTSVPTLSGATGVPDTAPPDTVRRPGAGNRTPRITEPADQSAGRSRTGASSAIPVTLPDPDSIFSPASRGRARRRAEAIYRRSDVSDSVRAEAARLVSQAWIEDKEWARARAWADTAYRLHPRETYREIRAMIDSTMRQAAN